MALRDAWRVYQTLHFTELAPKTRAEYRTAIESHVLRELPDKPTADDVKRWLRRQTGSIGYRNFQLRVLHTVVRTSLIVTGDRELGAAVLTVKPLRELPPSPRCPPRDFHVRALRVAQNPAERAWMRLAGEGGLRKGELLGLREDAIDYAMALVRVDRQRDSDQRKNRKPHAVRADPALLEDLRWTASHRSGIRPRSGFYRGRSDGFLFPWAEKFLEGFLGRVRASFGDEAKAYLPRGVAWHAWRHWGATELAHRGATLWDIMQWLGDRSEKAALRYIGAVRGATTAELVCGNRIEKVAPAERSNAQQGLSQPSLTDPSVVLEYAGTPDQDGIS